MGIFLQVWYRAHKADQTVLPTKVPPLIETILVLNDAQKYLEPTVLVLSMSIFNHFTGKHMGPWGKDMRIRFGGRLKGFKKYNEHYR